MEHLQARSWEQSLWGGGGAEKPYNCENTHLMTLAGDAPHIPSPGPNSLPHPLSTVPPHLLPGGNGDVPGHVPHRPASLYLEGGDGVEEEQGPDVEQAPARVRGEEDAL